MKKNAPLHLIAATGRNANPDGQAPQGSAGSADLPAEWEEDPALKPVRQKLRLKLFEELADSYAQCSAWARLRKKS